ncbi:DUF3219 family protein [Ureibacillus chungkukjangi]|uniref:Uncharacterized protein DUF3219 n=1 Tax=Ureibacillus chungkukjangi TaxID=1202712 RepID=A0A318TRU0_9BACL|nr:DUF3219 family protein [Ureibacillus chungkukjangi]PYF07324.1 uncharacterized protein DUF3219 [Ureibacillus chungkukjangi]
MVNKITLNDTVIGIEKYEEVTISGLHKIIIDFKVTSEDYHDISTLLYEGIFNISVPEKGLSFKGAIQEYSTSITNLYENGQVGDYHVSLLEVKE